MKKADAFVHWAALKPNQNPCKHFTAIAYRAKGSRYGACGIRIDGNPQFIDAVLSNLKNLLDGENSITRLELARSKVKPTEINGETRTFQNAEEQAEVCYIRLHERGPAAQYFNSRFDREGNECAERFADAKD